MSIKHTVTTAFATVALTASLGASAVMIKGTESSVHVDLSDLDLTTEMGEQTMQVRLKHAAKQVCGPTSVKSAGSFETARENRVCLSESYNNALDDVATTYLTASK